MGAHPETGIEESSIRDAVPGDLDDIMLIETASFPSPWSRQTFEQEIDRDWAGVWVVEPSEPVPRAPLIAAFLDFWCVLDEVHVLNLSTHPAYRRRGYARYLMQRLLSEIRLMGGGIVTLEVRTANRPARNLYSSLGFEITGIRKRYYKDTGEDAVVMLARIKSISA